MVRFSCAAVCCAAAVAMLAGRSAGAEPEIAELSLATDTNAVVDVEAGCTTVVSKVSGNRGTITKTGDGVLEVRLMRNTKVRFDVQGGKLRFARQVPRICDDAFFHVDSSRADTLELEEEHGTNFVVRWHDVRGNGNYATNSPWTTTWRPDPENRRAFISSVTQNGLPVVDFGSMLFNGLTNEVGEIQGYGATMTWNQACPAAREVYEVISDTPDVAEIGGNYPQFVGSVYGVSLISSTDSNAGNYRSYLKANGYPNIFHDTSVNYGWMNGDIYIDGAKQDPNSQGKAGKYAPPAGFNILGFTARTNDNYSVSVNAFARRYTAACGGQRIGEYLVYTNHLSTAERTILQNYLKEKWKGAKTSYVIASLTVADGASVEFAPDVSIKVANISDGSDVAVGNGSMLVNPLNNPDAFFHVDADDASTLLLEMRDGTNYVRRWDDALGNGVYATNYVWTHAFYNDPTNRFPFISDETLNNRPVVDFGSLLYGAYTNSAGQGIGHGGSLKWNSRMTAGAREAFTVVRDTLDVKTLYSVVGSKYGTAYICDPDSQHGYRHQLVNNDYPYMSYDNGYNDSIKSGTIKVDGTTRGFKNWRPSEGFHIFNFQLANTSLIKPQWFAYSSPKGNNTYAYAWGGTKIAEYLVFPNVLSNDVRTAIYSALRTKWFNATNAVSTLGNVSVAEGASLSFKWRDLVVTDRLSVGGELSADAVSAANLDLPAQGASVSGSLTVADCADVTAHLAADGSVGGLSAASLALAGGGTVSICLDGRRRAKAGEYPLLVSAGSFTGSIAGWSLDAAAARYAQLVLRDDGVYVRVEEQGSMILIR